MTWDAILDGIGTEIISLIIGGIIGGIGGYAIGIRKASKQQQFAGNKSEQWQENYITDADSVSSDKEKTNKDIRMEQYQEAGDESKQVQIGGINVK